MSHIEATDDLLDDLIRAGTPSHLVARVAMLIARHDVLAAADEKRKSRDVARKALIREDGDWAAIRRHVFHRDGFTCVYCDSPTDDPHCDHVIPLSKGGRSTLDNLVTACPECNVSKGARTPEEWRS